MNQHERIDCEIDVKDDPVESNNAIAKQPDVAKRLGTLLAKYRTADHTR